jgi:hypothetical protein
MIGTVTNKPVINMVRRCLKIDLKIGHLTKLKLNCKGLRLNNGSLGVANVAVAITALLERDDE